MDATWVSLLPPIMVIVAIFITHRLNVSLMLGIISAVLLVTQGSLPMVVMMLKDRVIDHFSDVNNIYLYIMNYCFEIFYEYK